MKTIFLFLSLLGCPNNGQLCTEFVHLSHLLTENFRAISPASCNSAAWRSWVLRGVFRGFSEEARTRGFPSPSFGGFGFIVAVTKYSRRLSDCLIVNIIRTYSSVGNVRFGSLAAPLVNISLMAAFGGKAVVQIARNSRF